MSSIMNRGRDAQRSVSRNRQFQGSDFNTIVIKHFITTLMVTIWISLWFHPFVVLSCALFVDPLAIFVWIKP